MTKHFRNVKTLAIIGILLFSIISAIVPTTSARETDGFIGLSSYLDVTWNETATQKPIVPRGTPKQLVLDIRYGVTRGWFLSDLLFNFYKGRQVNIKLEITDYSPWCTPGLKSGTITTVIKDGETILNNLLTIRVDENAPAFGAGFVKIKASVDKIGAIDGFEQEFYLEFSPAYLPLISAKLPKTNTMRIGPMDTAVFPIEVTNLGNARTKVYFEVDSVPEGWIAVVTDDIIIDEGEGSKGTAYLMVRPPKNFGYHDDDASIRVKMTPARAEDTSNIGNSEYVTVIVESRGFSIIGLEAILPIIIVVILLVAIAIWYLKKKIRL